MQNGEKVILLLKKRKFFCKRVFISGKCSNIPFSKACLNLHCCSNSKCIAYITSKVKVKCNFTFSKLYLFALKLHYQQEFKNLTQLTALYTYIACQYKDKTVELFLQNCNQIKCRINVGVHANLPCLLFFLNKKTAALVIGNNHEKSQLQRSRNPAPAYKFFSEEESSENRLLTTSL